MPKESTLRKIKNGPNKNRVIPYVRGFHPPDSKMQVKAIGFGNDVNSLPVEFSDINGPDDSKFFNSIPDPVSKDDWLAQYVEEGQSFKQYLRENPWFSARKHKFLRQKFVSSGNNICEKYPEGKVYVAKLGDFSTVSFEDLLDYVAKFLCLPVQQLNKLEIERKYDNVKFVEKPASNPTGRSTSRTRYTLLQTRHDSKTGHLQIRVDSILHKLRSVIPDDALCLIALTDYDLYGDETDLFVAGMASGNQRVAVFSLLRYDPALRFSKEFWYDISEDKKVFQEEKTRLMLQRSCKLVVHEICHLLGIDHCIYFSCCMNGSGHLEEDFRQPMMLCPVDLHKLQILIGFDVIKRYENLYKFYKYKGLKEEAEWTKKRIHFISSKST